MKADNFILRIYEGDQLIEQKFVSEEKIAIYFVQSRAFGNKKIWGELFRLDPNYARLISFDGEIEPATDAVKE